MLTFGSDSKRPTSSPAADRSPSAVPASPSWPMAPSSKTWVGIKNGWLLDHVSMNLAKRVVKEDWVWYGKKHAIYQAAVLAAAAEIAEEAKKHTARLAHRSAARKAVKKTGKKTGTPTRKKPAATVTKKN